MNSKVSWLALLGAAFLLLVHDWSGPDVWYHLHLGERVLSGAGAQPTNFLMLQQPGFVNFYWLFQAIIRALYTLLDAAGPTLLVAALWLVAAWQWCRLAGVFKSDALGLPLAVVALVVAQRRFELRPEAASYVLLLVELGWLCAWDPAKPTRWWRWIAPLAAQVVWCNVHGYFILGPLLVGLKALVTLAPQGRKAWDWRSWELRRLAGLFVAMLLAGLVSPLGWHNYHGVWAYVGVLGKIGDQIREFRRPGLQYWADAVFWLYVLVVAGAAVALARKWTKHLFALALAVVGLYLGLTALRNGPLLLIFSAPALAAATAALAPRFEKFTGRVRLGATAIAGVLALMAVTSVYGTTLHAPDRFGFGVARHVFPEHFTEYARKHPFVGRIFNDPNFGGWLEYHLPFLDLYGDSRYNDLPLVEEYFRALQDPEAFKELDRRFGFDGVFLDVEPSRTLVVALLQDPAWRLTYADLRHAFFTRSRTTLRVTDEVRFWRGEDVAGVPHQAYAFRWAEIAAVVERSDLLGQLLGELSGAKAVSPLLLEGALTYLIPRADEGLLAKVLALRPKMVTSDSDAVARVDKLIGMTPAAGRP